MKEGLPLQSDLFTGEWVDTRTRRQKQLDRERGQLRQTEMFSQREVAQFGVRARPQMDVHPGRLRLVMEDPRTPDEKEADLMREAQRLTQPMFSSIAGSTSKVVKQTRIPSDEASFPDKLVSDGLRRRVRAADVVVRRR